MSDIYFDEFSSGTPLEKRRVKNLIFDLGGVVINLRREDAVAALQKLGLKEADSMLGLYRQEEPFLGLETGRLSAAEFFDTLRPLCGGAPDCDIERAFDRFLIDIPMARLERLRNLREAGFKVYALSNTNPVMYNGWIANAFRAEGLTIHDYFDGAVASFQELCCKPDPEIFELILHRYALDPALTMMLDDSEANCRSALNAGMQARRVYPGPEADMLALTAPLL